MLEFNRIGIESARYSWLGRRSWQPLLEDISFELHSGEILALVGGSGEGKSLLLQTALALLPSNLRCRGEISLDGHPQSEQQLRQLRGHTLCYVPQGVNALNPLLSVGRQLSRAVQLSGQRVGDHGIEQQLSQYRLQPGVRHAYPRQLSGGMAKRILACSAALCQPRFILADEITAWLDESLSCQLLEHLRCLCEGGCGVLWVTHDLALASRYADRIIALENGRVREVIHCDELHEGGGSAQMQAHWQALPEQRFLSTQERGGQC
ncbi:ATP-binding cassette domain-containing protein [Dongshaea marina]|uniref:ATP-binding cassette domain-containing protein n=1 Tax=Dongshaea marina TaxID=2047966 RepID=UPI000D3E1D88|nr:ATP-binding cassette domain-containing protein [Dongshaea marina]